MMYYHSVTWMPFAIFYFHDGICPPVLDSCPLCNTRKCKLTDHSHCFVLASCFMVVALLFYCHWVDLDPMSHPVLECVLELRCRGYSQLLPMSSL